MQEVCAFVGLEIRRQLACRWRTLDERARFAMSARLKTIRQRSANLLGVLTRRHGVSRVRLRGWIVRLPRSASLWAMGMICRVCAPSLTPRKPGERIRSARRNRFKLVCIGTASLAMFGYNTRFIEAARLGAGAARSWSRCSPGPHPHPGVSSYATSLRGKAWSRGRGYGSATGRSPIRYNILHLRPT